MEDDVLRSGVVCWSKVAPAFVDVIASALLMLSLATKKLVDAALAVDNAIHMDLYGLLSCWVVHEMSNFDS